MMNIINIIGTIKNYKSILIAILILIICAMGYYIRYTKINSTIEVINVHKDIAEQASTNTIDAINAQREYDILIGDKDYDENNNYCTDCNITISL